MRLYTYQELETEIRQSLDIINSDSDNFISAAEMVNYVNEAIKTAESEVLGLNEDYFLTSAGISLVNGTSSYALPSGIYAQKIRALIYSNGSKIYPIQRIREPHLFYKKAEMDYYATSESEYVYILKNATAGAQSTIEISPSVYETGSYVTCWYLRDANRIPLVGEVVNTVTTTRAIQLATICDIPEWKDFIVQFVRVRCYGKEMDQREAAAAAILEDIKSRMNAALAKQVPDNDDAVLPDMGIYYDHN